MKINHNTSALQNVHSNAQMNEIRQKWAEKLGSGQRINRAADDPAGLSISEKMRGETGGLTQQRTNYQNAVSFMSAADGAMNEISNNLTDMQKLSAQLDNPLMSASDQSAVKMQLQARVDAITDTLDRAKINGISLFSENSVSGMTDAFVSGLRSLSADSSAQDIRAQADQVSSMRGALGSKANQAEADVRNVADQISNLTAAESRIRDANMADAYAGWSSANIMSGSSNAMLAHSMIGAQNVMTLLQ